MSWKYRFALKNLVLKDFKIRYRNMALGMVWSVLNPLVMLGVLVFVFSFLYPHNDNPYFPVFVLLGLIPFNFFQFCVVSGTSCFVENASLLKKLTFPRYILPLSVALSQTIHLVIQLLLLVVFLVVFRVPFTWAFLWLPVVIALEFLFIAGVLLACSTLNVFYRDVLYIVQSGLTIMFWFTPIFYDISAAHKNLSRPWYLLYLVNPLAGYIEALRRSLLKGLPPERDSFIMALLVTAITFIFGMAIYRKAQARLTDYV
jgi:lipopolysaccharide transport system permease protein